MSVKLPSKIEGFRSEVINGIIDYCRSITLDQRNVGIIANRRADGTSLAAISDGDRMRPMRKLFDFLQRGTVDFRIRAEYYTAASQPITGVSVLGVWRGLSAGDELSLVTGGLNPYFKPTDDVDGEKFVYVILDRATPTSPLMAMGDTLPNGTDTTEIAPLYYLAWDSAAEQINWRDSIDLRGHISLPGMS